MFLALLYFLHLFFPFLEASEVILDEESCIEFTHSHIIITYKFNKVSLLIISDIQIILVHVYIYHLEYLTHFQHYL